VANKATPENHPGDALRPGRSHRTGRRDGGGKRHEISFAVDEIRQQPVIGRTAHEAADVKTATSVKVHWPPSACSELRDAEPRFLHLALSYAFLNPHLDLCVDWFGVQHHREPTDPGWQKWLPSRPTSAHWYGRRRRPGWSRRTSRTTGTAGRRSGSSAVHP